MKTKSDPRHIARMKAMQALFSFDFNKHDKDQSSEIANIVRHMRTLDGIIAKSAPAFPVDKIAKVDLAILRLSVYELLIEKKNPPKVVIDEAVELAKEFGNDTSGSFINGVLGSVVREEKTYGNKSN